MTAMLLVGIAIAVLLYIVVQRLDRIIVLQTEQRDLQTEQRDLQTVQRDALIHIADLLEVPYREELDRKRSEKAGRERGKADPLLEKAIADFGRAVGADRDPGRSQ